MTKEEYDVFFSYVHKDKDSAIRIVEALRASGIKVWFDENEIKDYDGIIRHLTKGLSHSKALVAYYSAKYPKSRFCQWEFTSAFLAGQREGDPTKRIMVLNPEEGHEHIMPSEFQGALFKRALENSDDAALRDIVESIKERVSSIDDLIGHISTFDKPTWYGRNGVFYPNFVGRLGDMWNIHTKLNSYETILITSGTAQVQGMGGIGKSLFVEEYAMRFGAAYSGGIYWLSASQANTQNLDSELERQLHYIALELGIRKEAFETSKEEERLPLILGALKHQFESQNKSYLWIADDVPAGMNSEKLRRWFAPHHNGKTLITTRSTEYNIAERIPLDVLEKGDAYTLITSRKKPKDETEEKAAREIIDMLGYHALAIDIAASAIQFQSYSEFLEGLKNPEEDELELAAELTGQLPNGHEPSIATTLLRSIKLLGNEGKDFLRLASILAETPIPSKLVEKVFELYNGIDESEARKMSLQALHQVNTHSLATPVEGEDAWEIHTLISRTIRYQIEKYESGDCRNKLREAVIKALAAILSTSTNDVRLHHKIRFEIIHSRDFIKKVVTIDESSLACWVASYDYYRGYYNSAERLWNHAMNVIEDALGKDSEEVFKINGSIVQAVHKQGNLKDAQEIGEELVIKCKRELGVSHHETLRNINNLAEIHRDRGNIREALKLQNEVLEHISKLPEAEKHKALNLMINLAASQLDTGDIKGARGKLTSVLRDCRKLYGADHVITLAAMNSLARVFEKSHPRRALIILKRTVEMSEDALQEDHPVTVRSNNNYAGILYEMGCLKEAREIQEKILEISVRKWGKKHYYTSSYAWNLYNTLTAVGDVKRSKKILDSYLHWILESDTYELHQNQKSIRDQISTIIGPK